MYSRRDTHEKGSIALGDLVTAIPALLDEIHENMYEQTKKFLHGNVEICSNMDEFRTALDNQHFVKTMWCGCRECEDAIKAETAASARVMPFDQTPVGDKCVYCGKPATKAIYFAKSY